MNELLRLERPPRDMELARRQPVAFDQRSFFCGARSVGARLPAIDTGRPRGIDADVHQVSSAAASDAVLHKFGFYRIRIPRGLMDD